MSCVRLGAQSHVPSVVVEMPDQARILPEGLWCGELDSGMASPDSASAAECRQARSSGEASSTQCEDSI